MFASKAAVVLLVVWFTSQSMANPKESSDAQWIWSSDLTSSDLAYPGSRAFRRDFNLTNANNPTSCDISIAIAHPYHLFVNGDLIGSGRSNPEGKTRTAVLQPGFNVFALNTTSRLARSPGVLIDITIPYGNGLVAKIVSDPSWSVSIKVEPGFEKLGYDHSRWPPAVVVKDPMIDQGADSSENTTAEQKGASATGIGLTRSTGTSQTLNRTNTSMTAPSSGAESTTEPIGVSHIELVTGPDASISETKVSTIEKSLSATSQAPQIPLPTRTIIPVQRPSPIPEYIPLSPPVITSLSTVTVTSTATAPALISSITPATPTIQEKATTTGQRLRKVVKKRVIKRVRVVNGVRSTSLQTSVTTEYLTARPTQT